ncbi:MAG: hypothetical protein AAF846_29825 [Chloroflexota bacterium]
MENPTTNQQHPDPPYSWLDAVIMLANAPTLATLQRILDDDTMTAQRAYLWVAIAGAIFGIALAIYYPPTILPSALWVGVPAFAVEISNYQPPVWAIVLIGILVGSINSVIGYMGQTWLLQRVGMMMGADNSYETIAILRGIIYPILLGVRALILIIVGYNTVPANILLFVTIMLDFLATAFILRVGGKLSLQQSMLVVMGMNLGIFVGIVLFTSTGAFS